MVEVGLVRRVACKGEIGRWDDWDEVGMNNAPALYTKAPLVEQSSICVIAVYTEQHDDLVHDGLMDQAHRKARPRSNKKDRASNISHLSTTRST
jgi:hypothetical protein